MTYKIGIIGLGSLGAAYASMAMDSGHKKRTFKIVFQFLKV